MSPSLLTFCAYAMIVVFMALIMTKRMSVLTALALVPMAFGVIAGILRMPFTFFLSNDAFYSLWV